MTKHSQGDGPYFDLRCLVNMDQAFKRAMLRELRAGTEKFDIGVVKSIAGKTSVRSFWTQSDRSSPIGSPSAMCSDSN